MYLEEVDRGWRGRVGDAFNRAERIYLKILRAMILVIATALIGLTLWLTVLSLYKLSRSPNSVEQEVATVRADELVNSQGSDSTPAVIEKPGKPTASPEQRAFYREFIDRYYQLFRARFERFRQAEDKQLSRDEFDDSFIMSEQRLERVVTGELDFTQDRDDLRNLLLVMTSAADNQTTRERLQGYQRAKKMPVQATVQRTRTEYRRGWDSSSTACSDWYYSPVGCPVQRAIQVPYTESVTSMEFPKGTKSHTALFRAFQDRYFELLTQRRDMNASKANAERQKILAGKVEGSGGLMMALQIFGAFLAVMFFFLLIAIERHQRRISDATIAE
jgi:preprotein translocase subunit SecG